MGDIRRILGPVYPLLLRIKTSEQAREASAALGLPTYYFARRRNPGDFAIDIYPRMGMGAAIAKALLFHAVAEDLNLRPAIVSSNSLYLSGSGRDFLPRYFQRPVVTREFKSLSGNSYLWALRHVAPATLPLARASRLFSQFFKPTSLVGEALETVKAGRAAFDLAVHYRGTDKVHESGTVDVSRIFAELDRAIAALGRQPDIFLATDDSDFESLLRSRYPSATFTTYNLAVVPPGIARHFSQMAADEKALEAIVNILLIASAPLCIRTSSYLSSISKIANPSMRTVTINKTLNSVQIFPEHEVLKLERES